MGLQSDLCSGSQVLKGLIEYLGDLVWFFLSHHNTDELPEGEVEAIPELLEHVVRKDNILSAIDTIGRLLVLRQTDSF